MSCRLGRRSWGADLGEAGPQSREGAQNVGRTICDRSRKFGVEQPSGRGRNGRMNARCHRLFLVTRWGSFAKETARSQCTSEYYILPSTIVERKPANYWVDAGRTGNDQKARVLHEPQFFTRRASGSSVLHLRTLNWGISQ